VTFQPGDRATYTSAFGREYAVIVVEDPYPADSVVPGVAVLYRDFNGGNHAPAWVPRDGVQPRLNES